MSEDAQDTPQYSPFLYWAQTSAEVTIRVDLRNVKSPDVDLDDDHLIFSAIGVGAHGETNYRFHLKFNQLIDTAKSKYKVTDRQVDFNLRKTDSIFWPRLLEEAHKPAWLKIDFEKFQHEEDFEDESRDILDDYPGLYDKMKAQEMGWVQKRESLKKVYLFLYNLWQFVGFLYMITVMSMRYAKEGPESIGGTFHAVSWMMKMSFISQFLEVFHPMLGYTKGSAIVPLLQCSGRAVIFFFLIASEERLQEKPVVFYLFFIWCLVEIVRYPYYLLSVYDLSLGLLTWLRYTMWIPLYPLGFLCEGVVILRSIPYFEETGKYTVSLPNKWNFAFHFPSLLRIYLLLFFFPMMYRMMSHMQKQRSTKIGPPPKSIKKKD